VRISSNLITGSVHVFLPSIETRAMRVYAAQVGRPVKDRPGWVRLTARGWHDRPGVRGDWRPPAVAGRSLRPRSRFGLERSRA